MKVIYDKLKESLVNTKISMPISVRSTITQNTLIIFAIAFIGIFMYFTFFRFFTNKNQDSSPIIAPVVSGILPSPTLSPTNPLNPKTPYYGVDVDMSQLLSGSSNYYKNYKGQDYIDIAHHLGMTIFRITNVTRGFTNEGTYQTFSEQQWNKVLNKMAQDNIKAVILIESPSSDASYYSDSINSSYIKLVKQYIIDSNVGYNPDVIGIDLINEPDLTSNNLNFIIDAKQMIKAKYPKMPVTVGGWKVADGKFNKYGVPQYTFNTPSDGALLSNIVDFYAVHIYGFDQKNILGDYPDPYTVASQFLSQIVQFTAGKPILVEEFGASNGTTVTDQETVGSEELQANAYDGMYRAIINFKNQGVFGSTSYLFAPRGATNDSWAIMSKDGNTLYPAAYVLQKYATGGTDLPLTLPMNPVPDSFVLSNKNDGNILPVQLQDNIGIALTLPVGKYYLSVNPSNLVSVSENMTYYENYYEAVVHAIEPGTEKVTVYNKAGCSASMASCIANVVYSFTLQISL